MKKYTKIVEAEKRVFALDNWYPCYPFHMVKAECFLMDESDRNYYIRILVSGRDDTAMSWEATLEDVSISQARYAYERIKEKYYKKIPILLSKEWLYKHGFERF